MPSALDTLISNDTLCVIGGRDVSESIGFSIAVVTELAGDDITVVNNALLIMDWNRTSRRSTSILFIFAGFATWLLDGDIWKQFILVMLQRNTHVRNSLFCIILSALVCVR